jgi:tetratricopeptide (TPR) repeat protein
LHTLILSRIDQLTEQEKTTLRAASIIGRLFQARWLAGYYPELGADRQVKIALDELARLELTPLNYLEPELAYLFKHVVTHEVTYESLPFATRARLHERLAIYLENTFPDFPPLETLAFHYTRTDNLVKQREYLRKAGDAAEQSFANEAALAYYGQLLPLFTGEAEQVAIRMRRGAVLELMGRWDESEGDYRAALEIARQIQDPARLAEAQFALGKLSHLRGDLDLALTWLGQAEQAYTALADQVALADTLIERGRLLNHKVEYAQAREILNQGLALAREASHKPGTALALESLGLVVTGERGDRLMARDLFEASLAIRREIGDRKGIASSLGYLGAVANGQGEYATARALLQESLAMTRVLGNKKGIADLLTSLGSVVYNQGDFTAARTLFEETLAMMREMGSKAGMASSLMNIGLVCSTLGDYTAAQSAYEEGVALFDEMGIKAGLVFALGNMGYLALCQKDYSAAQALYEKGLGMADEMDSKWDIAVALGGLGAATLGQGDPIAARTFYAESLPLFVAADDKLNILVNLAGLAEVAVTVGSTEFAAQLAAAVKSVLTQMDASFEPLEKDKLEQTIALARAELGESAFQAAWEAGARLSMEEAVRMASEHGNQ